jgi:hypothetical protein
MRQARRELPLEESVTFKLPARREHHELEPAVALAAGTQAVGTGGGSGAIMSG